MNGLYLVCDGGGTKTDFLLFEKTGRVRGRAQGAGANANFVPPAEAAHTVYAGVMECLAQAGAAPGSPHDDRSAEFHRRYGSGHNRRSAPHIV